MDRHLEQLRQIWRSLDTLYHATREHYGFTCEGCTDNCCETKFYHHTLIEERYLAEGLKNLDDRKRIEVLSRAEEVIEVYAGGPEDVRVMCPLNERGLCVLYESRPMICRMHGVPHEVHKRGLPVEYGSGCFRFIKDAVGTRAGYFPFDRTPFYAEVARIEKEVRDLSRFRGRYKKTVADMIMSILGR